MRHADLRWFIRLSDALNLLKGDLAGEDGLSAIRDAQQYLWWLVDERPEWPLSLDTSRPLLRQLFITNRGIIDDEPNAIEKLDSSRVEISRLVERLLPVLLQELANQPAFIIAPKRAYNTRTLILDGVRMLDTQTRDSLTDEERYDVKEAARCLAFEVPTAVAFHLFRAMEGVLRRYCAVVISGANPKKQPRSWDAYITNMKKYGSPDSKVIFMLNEVRWLFRNPIMHPEEQVSLDSAAALFGLADTVLNVLTSEIRRLSP
jgi:hypothetical protein